MPSANKPDPAAPFDAGRALVQSFAIFASNAGALALMTLLINLPLVAYQLHLIITSPALPQAVEGLPTILSPEELVRAQRQMGVLMGGGIFSTALATGAVTHGVLRQMEGKPAPFVECLQVAVRRAATILAINTATLMAVFFGTLALFVPGFIAATLLSVAAFKRSIDLTRGSRWGVFGLWLMPISLVMGLHLIALRALVDVHAEHPLEDQRFQAVSVVLSVLFQTLSAVTATVAYRKLRQLRDGTKPADLSPTLD